jgi:hypothetical protein
LRRTSDTSATGNASPLIARRARTPRQYSCPTAAKTNAANENMISDVALLVTPATSSTASVPSAAPAGTANTLRRLAGVARRQAMTGPTPDSSTRTSASGVM